MWICLQEVCSSVPLEQRHWESRSTMEGFLSQSIIELPLIILLIFFSTLTSRPSGFYNRGMEEIVWMGYCVWIEFNRICHIFLTINTRQRLAAQTDRDSSGRSLSMRTLPLPRYNAVPLDRTCTGMERSSPYASD